MADKPRMVEITEEEYAALQFGDLSSPIGHAFNSQPKRYFVDAEDYRAWRAARLTTISEGKPT